MDNMIKCKACDAENHQEAAFCTYCGKALVEVQKTKKVSKLALVSLVVILLSVGTGFTAYKIIKPGSQLTKSYKDNYELNNLLIMSYGDNKENKSANLYFQSEGTDKQLIAEKVNFDTYTFAPKTNQVAYMDESSHLFVAKLGEEPVEISKQVNMEYISFTSDEKYIIFCEDKDSSSSIYIYNIEEDSKEKLDDSISPYVSKEYDEATKTLYFLGQDQALYKYNEEIGKEKIKKNVYLFKVLNESLIMYQTYKEGQAYYYMYNMQNEEEEKLGFNYMELYNATLSNDEKVIFFLGQEKDSDSDRISLYIKVKDQEPIKFQKDVLSYAYAPDINTIYYINNDNMLYSVKMPTFNKKALEDSELAEATLTEVEKNKIFSGATAIKVSADGKKVGAQSEDMELTLLIGGEKLKVAKDIQDYDVFNNYIVYLNADKELYVQKDIGVSDVSKITSKPEQIAKKVKDFYNATEYGKYVTYIEEENEKDPTYKFMRYSEDGTVKVMLDNLDEYDAVSFNNMKYVRKLKYKDVVGKYSCEGFDFVLELDKDNNLSIYNTGVKRGDSKVSAEPLTKDAIRLSAEQEQTITINTYSGYEDTWYMALDANLILTKNLEGTYTLESSNNGVYMLELMTDEAFNEEIQRQKEAEEERLRIEEERRRAEEEERQRRSELEDLASQYYYQGVYLPSGTYIYDNYDYNSITTYYTSLNETWSVSDYYINYESSVIWVKIKYRPGSSYTYKYGWIPMY